MLKISERVLKSQNACSDLMTNALTALHPHARPLGYPGSCRVAVTFFIMQWAWRGTLQQERGMFMEAFSSKANLQRLQELANRSADIVRARCKDRLGCIKCILHMHLQDRRHIIVVDVRGKPIGVRENRYV